MGLGSGSSRSPQSGGGDPADPEVAFNVVGAMRERMQGGMEARPLIQPRDRKGGNKEGFPEEVTPQTESDITSQKLPLKGGRKCVPDRRNCTFPKAPR